MIILRPVETEQYTLEVIECYCGFHIGLDATYLDQVDQIRVRCPSCNLLIDTKEIYSLQKEAEATEYGDSQIKPANTNREMKNETTP